MPSETTTVTNAIEFGTPLFTDCGECVHYCDGGCKVGVCCVVRSYLHHLRRPVPKERPTVAMRVKKGESV